MEAKKPKVIIIGAGMAGLTAANHLYTTAGDQIQIQIMEAGPRIGGRIFTSEFSNTRIEMGATWIPGIDGNPIYSLASKTNSLSSTDNMNYERMDGYPQNPLTFSASGSLLTPDFIQPISTLYRNLIDSARCGKVTATNSSGVGDYLRRGLKAYCSVVELSGELTEKAEAVFEMEMNEERTHTSADDLDDLNLAAEWEYRDFPGDQITIAEGYSRVIEGLAADLPQNTIKLNCNVEKIDWLSEDGHVRVHMNGDVAVADHVIVTVSLGVLKAGLKKKAVGGGSVLEFSPALPEFKKEAIERLGFGVVDKLFVEMNGGDEAFPFVQFAYNDGMKIPKWTRKTASICPVYKNSHVLLTWLAGKEAMEMEELGDDAIVSGVDAMLDEYLPDGTRCKYGRISRVKRSGWGKNPLFLGSYSYVAVGSSGDDLDLMTEPLPRGRDVDGLSSSLQILFAGEATHRSHYSTTHGAYFSGIREADRLLQYYRIAGISKQSLQVKKL